jgi:hypothetical protein
MKNESQKKRALRIAELRGERGKRPPPPGYTKPPADSFRMYDTLSDVFFDAALSLRLVGELLKRIPPDATRTRTHIIDQFGETAQDSFGRVPIPESIDLVLLHDALEKARHADEVADDLINALEPRSPWPSPSETPPTSGTLNLITSPEVEHSRRRMQMPSMQDDDDNTTWKELFPDGRTIFYEGEDPDEFVAEMKRRFGFDPSTVRPPPGDGFVACRMSWDECRAFYCPPHLLDAIYGDDDLGRRHRLCS